MYYLVIAEFKKTLRVHEILCDVYFIHRNSGHYMERSYKVLNRLTGNIFVKIILFMAGTIHIQ